MNDETSELWVIEGRRPVLWTIPCYVSWRPSGDGVMCYAMAQIGTPQIMALREHMRYYGREFNGGWIVSRHELVRTGKSVQPGTNPEAYFSWHLPRLADMPEHHTQQREERNDFLDSVYLSQSTGLDRTQLEYVWRQFCTQIGEWIINREKPVDFYFFTLHPSPYRENWKTVLLTDFAARTSKAMFRGNGDALKNMDVRQMFLQSKLLATHRDLCLRRIELEHKPAWWKHQIKTERHRYRTLGAYQYANEFLNFCIRCLDRSKRLFSTFIQEDNAPAPSDVPGDVAGHFRFVSPKKSEELSQSFLCHSAAPAAIAAPASEAKEAGEPQSLPGTNGALPALRDIQPETQDVRQQGEHVPESSNGTG